MSTNNGVSLKCEAFDNFATFGSVIIWPISCNFSSLLKTVSDQLYRGMFQHFSFAQDVIQFFTFILFVSALPLI